MAPKVTAFIIVLSYICIMTLHSYLSYYPMALSYPPFSPFSLVTFFCPIIRYSVFLSHEFHHPLFSLLLHPEVFFPLMVPFLML